MTKATRGRTTRRLLTLLLCVVGAAVTAAAPSQQAKYGNGNQGAIARRFRQGAMAPGDAPLVVIGGQPHVSKQAYLDLRNASLALLKTYPPDKHVYIGLGRDPAPFIAFLQEVGADAINFPASGGSFAASPELDRHFQQLIPPEIRQGNRTIVLIDQTRSGKTHNAMMPLLRSFLQRTGAGAPVIGVVYNNGTVLNQPNVNNLHVIDTGPFPEVFKFFYAPYEGVVSPFSRHVPGTNTVEQLQWRTEYGQFRQALGQRIEADPELDTFLAQFGPPLPPPAPPPQATPGGRRTRFAAWGATRIWDANAASLGAAAILNLKRKKESYAFLDQAGYDAISWGSRELLRRFPPASGRFYLGVGRSSSAIVAFLENLGVSAGYFPSDGLKNDTVDAALEASFQAYFARFIPAAVLQRGGTITLFQQSDTGRTMAAIAPMLQRWIAAQGSRSQVELVAYSTKATPAGVTRIDTRAHQTLQELNGDAFKAVAVQTYHRIGTDAIADLGVRKHYGQFKAALLERMKRDGALDKFLAEAE